jgi:simple sugar transport system permease protein
VVVVATLFYKTPLGYAMRTVGANPQFARYAGIGVTGTIVAAQLIGGAFAGLGGVVEILGRHERFRWLEMPGYGFDGLLVAVIAHRNPAFVPVGALLLAYIRTSADIVTRTTDIPAEFVSIVQGIIILLIAAEMFLSGTKRKLIYRAAKSELQKETGEAA